MSVFFFSTTYLTTSSVFQLQFSVDPLLGFDTDDAAEDDNNINTYSGLPFYMQH
jgi:hypothetical protein